MTDRTDQDQWPSPRGPWDEVIDMNQLFDHGASWCVNAEGHPDPDGGYPDPNIHVPAHECHTRALWLDAITDDLAGPRGDLAIYAARAFRYGEHRTTERVKDTRIVFERIDSPSEARSRFSVDLGDALRIAHHLIRLVQAIDHSA